MWDANEIAEIEKIRDELAVLKRRAKSLGLRSLVYVIEIAYLEARGAAAIRRRPQ